MPYNCQGNNDAARPTMPIAATGYTKHDEQIGRLGGVGAVMPSPSFSLAPYFPVKFGTEWRAGETQDISPIGPFFPSPNCKLESSENNMLLFPLLSGSPLAWR